MFKKILIANRGEIVNRIMRAAGSLGIESVVIYSEADTGLDYLDSPVEKYLLKGSTLTETYLNQQQIIHLAKISGADAIHPGYGFLSENAGFARECEKNQIGWIGPSSKVMGKMSGKESSHQQAIQAGIPVLRVIKGTPGDLSAISRDLSFPILIKAAGGGGGRGIRIVRQPEDFHHQVELASIEAERFFNNPEVFAEPYIEQARHIEVQIIGDKHGNLVHLFERECTIQRRYQKMIEESPSPSITNDQRNAMISDAVKLSKLVDYDSAGTVEFLLGPDGQHYFMEMNTRIQVEHPVTERVTGIDIVAEQIRVAAGNTLSIKQENIVSTGHSIECRICAEDPAADFNARPGLISLFHAPVAEAVRVDHAIGTHFSVSPLFDSMIAKIIVHGPERKSALEKMSSALGKMVVHGVTTNSEYLREIFNHPDFLTSKFHTGFNRLHALEILNDIDLKKKEPLTEIFHRAYETFTLPRPAANTFGKSSGPWTNSGSWRIHPGKLLEYRGEKRLITQNGIDGKTYEDIVCSIHTDGSAWVSKNGFTYQVTEPHRSRSLTNHAGAGDDKKNAGEKNIHAPLPGLLTRLMVKEGDQVIKGDQLAIIESMKTENHILAGSGGKIGAIRVVIGQPLRMNELIMEIETNTII